MEEKIKKYAYFLLKRCLGMKQGEPLVISYSSEQRYFVDLVIDVAKKMNINERKID